MLMLRRFLILAGMTAALAYQTALAAEPTYKPPQGFVPNEKVAIAIAVAIWGPIYGAAQVAQEKPYHAKLVNGVWWVSGSLPRGWSVGGVAEARIQKVDGRILGVTHGQ
jgi:NTF2 fold immunity protein